MAATRHPLPRKKEETLKENHAFADRAKRFVVRRTVTLSVLLAIAMVLSFGARWHWTLDLLSHFPVLTAIAAAICLAILLGLRRPRMAILPGVVVAVSVAQLLPLYLPPNQPAYSGDAVHAIAANVLRSNRRCGDFIEYIRASRPDFVLVMEVDERWLDELTALENEYPHRIARPGCGAFGIALYSHMPITDHEIIESAVAGVPMIRATLDFKGRSLSVVGAHPLPPVKSGTAELRNGQLREIAALTAPLPNPRVLLGDLNVTSWSPHFADLLEQTALRDGRRGFGIQPSWPRLPWPMRIPIDHTLVSDDVEVVSRRLGPHIGSDHRPVEIGFRIGQ